jgi:acetyl-CoA carboxylase carboxyl transferase subunit beta
MTETYRKRDRILLGSGALVMSPSGHRVLMVKHRDMDGDFWRAKWIFPGGLVEHGELLAEAAAREVREETGLTVRLGNPIPPHDRVERDIDGKVTLHVVYHVHWAIAEGDELTPGDDVAVARWFSADEISENRGDIHEDTLRLIELSGLVDHLRKGMASLPDDLCFTKDLE